MRGPSSFPQLGHWYPRRPSEGTSGIRVRIPTGPAPLGNRPGTAPVAAPPPANRRRIAARWSDLPGRRGWTEGSDWSASTSFLGTVAAVQAARGGFGGAVSVAPVQAAGIGNRAHQRHPRPGRPGAARQPARRPLRYRAGAGPARVGAATHAGTRRHEAGRRTSTASTPGHAGRRASRSMNGAGGKFFGRRDSLPQRTAPLRLILYARNADACGTRIALFTKRYARVV